jgi:hypothetical protein
MTLLAPTYRVPEVKPEEVIDHPSGFLALSRRNRRFTLPGRRGFLAFREQGMHARIRGSSRGART